MNASRKAPQGVGTNRLLKYYQRESQADLDAIDHARRGWKALKTRWSEAAQKWEVEYELPPVLTLMGMMR